MFIIFQEQCATKYEEQCETKYDTEYEKKCETKYDTTYEKQCETKYDTEYEKQCETKYEQQCQTKYETQFETKYEEKCETQYETQYETKYEDKCETKVNHLMIKHFTTYSCLDVRSGKKSPNQETGLGNRGFLMVLNDTKLILNYFKGVTHAHLGPIWYHSEPSDV